MPAHKSRSRADLVPRCASDPAFLALHRRQLTPAQWTIVTYLRDHGSFTSWGWNANSAAEKDEALRLIHPPVAEDQSPVREPVAMRVRSGDLQPESTEAQGGMQSAALVTIASEGGL